MECLAGKSLPILTMQTVQFQVTVCKIGDRCIVDPTSAEEQCAGGLVVVAVSKNNFSTILQTGGGSLQPSTFIECLNLGKEVAGKLDGALISILNQINQDEIADVGFLK